MRTIGTATQKVTLALEPAGGPPGRWPVEPYNPTSHYYKARLGYQGRYAEFPFQTGSGWERPPVAREVLECVLADAGMVRGVSTADEAAALLLAEHGEDAYPEEGEAKRLGAALLSVARKVERLLGDECDAALDDPEAFAWRVTDDPPASVARASRPSPMVRRFEGRIGICDEGPVLLEVELRATREGLELSVCASTPHGGGQHRVALETMREYAPGWDAEKVARLREVWEAWHLNGMRSACEHQRALGWTYDTHRDPDPDAPGFPYAGQACPECGYRIGSAWLFQEIPADVVAFLEGLAPELARPDAVEAFRYYTRADQGERVALEATYPEIVGTFEHDREAEDR